MKRILSLVVMSLFLCLGVLFAGNATHMKIGVKYANGKNVVVNATDDNATVYLYVTLYDENGSYATAGPNGESLASLASSIDVTTTLGATATCSLDYGSTYECDLSYANISTPYAPGTKTDKVTVKVDTLSETGILNIESPVATGLALVLPGAYANTITQPKVLGDIPTEDNDAGYQFRLPGDKVPFYVYAVNSKGTFTDNYNGDVTIKTAKGETFTCTMTGGVCSGELSITKFDNGTPLQIEAYTGTLATDNSTVVFNNDGYQTGIAFFKNNMPMKPYLGFFNNNSDNVTVCAVDSNGNIVSSAKIKAISFNTSALNDDNITIAHTATGLPCLSFKVKDSDNDGIYKLTSGKVVVTADIGLPDNVTNSFMLYADNNTTAHLPKIIKIDKTNLNAGDEFTVTVASSDNTSLAPNSKVYNIADYDNVTVGAAQAEIVSAVPSKSAWTFTLKVTKAGTYNNITFHNAKFANLNFANNTTFTVNPDLASLKVKINYSPTGEYFVANGEANPLFYYDNVTVIDKYGNPVNQAITSVTSEKGTIEYDTTTKQYSVKYPLGTTGSDNITVTCGGVSSYITIPEIVAPASGYEVLVSKIADYNVFSSSTYPLSTPLELKICSNGYLKDPHQFTLKVDNGSLAVYDGDTQVISESTLSTSGSIPPGYETCKTYTVTSEYANTYTLTISDPSTASPWASDNVTLTFGNLDTQAPSIDNVTVIAGGIKAKVTDNTKVESVKVTVTDADGNVVKSNVDMTAVPDNPGWYQIISLQPGLYLFDITAIDSEGNSYTHTYAREVTAAAPSCSADNLGYCTTQTDCEGAGGIWDNTTNTCSAPPVSTVANPTLEPQTNVTAPTKTVEVASDNATIEPQLTIASGDNVTAYYVLIEMNDVFYVWTGTSFAPLNADLSNLSPVASGYYTVSGNTVSFAITKDANLSGLKGQSVVIWYGYMTSDNKVKYNAFTLAFK